MIATILRRLLGLFRHETCRACGHSLEDHWHAFSTVRSRPCSLCTCEAYR